MTAVKKDWEPIKSLCLVCKQYTAFAGFKICGKCHEPYERRLKEEIKLSSSVAELEIEQRL